MNLLEFKNTDIKASDTEVTITPTYIHGGLVTCFTLNINDTKKIALFRLVMEYGVHPDDASMLVASIEAMLEVNRIR